MGDGQQWLLAHDDAWVIADLIATRVRLRIGHLLLPSYHMPPAQAGMVRGAGAPVGNTVSPGPVPVGTPAAMPEPGKAAGDLAALHIWLVACGLALALAVVALPGVGRPVEEWSPGFLITTVLFGGCGLVGLYKWNVARKEMRHLQEQPRDPHAGPWGPSAPGDAPVSGWLPAVTLAAPTGWRSDRSTPVRPDGAGDFL